MQQIRMTVFRPRGRKRYVETFDDPALADQREAQLRGWGYCVLRESGATPPAVTKSRRKRRERASKNLRDLARKRRDSLAPQLAEARKALTPHARRLAKLAAGYGRVAILDVHVAQDSCADLAVSPRLRWLWQVGQHTGFGPLGALLFVERAGYSDSLSSACADIRSALGGLS